MRTVDEVADSIPLGEIANQYWREADVSYCCRSCGEETLGKELRYVSVSFGAFYTCPNCKMEGILPELFMEVLDGEGVFE